MMISLLYFEKIGRSIHHTFLNKKDRETRMTQYRDKYLSGMGTEYQCN